jgi:tRNA-dihydrouridine synthase B
VAEARGLIVAHLEDHYAFYGETAGVRIARKHLGWYTEALDGGATLRREANAAITRGEQLDAVERFFDRLLSRGDRLLYIEGESVADQRDLTVAVPLPTSQQTTSNANRAREALAA